MYTPGYSGPLSAGFSDSFLTVKIRNGLVTSITDGPYVPTEHDADLLVACGGSRDRISSLRVGDEVNCSYTLDQGGLLITDAVSAGPLLYLEGEKVLDPQKEGFAGDSYLVSGLAARSLLATDWYGGLILLAVIKNDESVGTDFSGLMEIIDGLPMKVKSATALDGGHASSLVFKDGGSIREIASGGRVAVGLLLIPTDR
jgi:hypothetical protein